MAVDTTAIIDLLPNKTDLFTIQHGKGSPAERLLSGPQPESQSFYSLQKVFHVPGIVKVCPGFLLVASSRSTPRKKVRNNVTERQSNLNVTLSLQSCFHQGFTYLSFLPVADRKEDASTPPPLSSTLTSWAGPDLRRLDVFPKHQPHCNQLQNHPAHYSFGKIWLCILIAYYLTNEPNLRRTIKINPICISLLPALIHSWNICAVSGHLFEEFHN